MTPAQQIADDTWHRLRGGQDLAVRLGEETLTDLLILDLKRRMDAQNIWVHQTTRPQEASSGTDLLMVVRDVRTTGARLYALQAKKLYPNHQYAALRKVNDAQLDALEKFARLNKALPYYLFYNFVTDPEFVAHPSDYWHCRKKYDQSQLGCTLVPSWIVRKATGAPRQSRPRSFVYMHKPRQALPWRCLFDCPHWEHGLRDAWTDATQKQGLASENSRYDQLTLDPVPEAWPTGLTGENEADLALITARFVEDREIGFELERRVLPDAPSLSPITGDRAMTVASRSRPPEFRPRRFIFVDKGVQ